MLELLNVHVVIKHAVSKVGLRLHKLRLSGLRDAGNLGRGELLLSAHSCSVDCLSCSIAVASFCCAIWANSGDCGLIMY